MPDESGSEKIVKRCLAWFADAQSRWLTRTCGKDMSLESPYGIRRKVVIITGGSRGLIL